MHAAKRHYSTKIKSAKTFLKVYPRNIPAIRYTRMHTWSIIQYSTTGPPSTLTVDSVEYLVVDLTTGRFRFLVSSSGAFRTRVTISASVVVTDNIITATGLSYIRSHTVSVVATSDVCPGVLNSSTVVPVVFNIRSE